MLSNISEFEVLLERYDHDPGICNKLLRKHSQNDPKSFLDYAQEALLERPVSRALKFIAGFIRLLKKGSSRNPEQADKRR